MIFNRQLLTAGLAVLLFSCHSRQPADLILYHGKVYTVDSGFSTAGAFGVKDGKILAVGTDEDIRARYAGAKEIDAGGKAVYPGLQPYDDKPGWQGFLLSSPAHFDSLAGRLAGTDFQLCTHAIGDSANRVILKIYNKYLSGKNDERWRIEHAQVVDGADFYLFGKASVVPSVQPTHATSDMYWAGERLGTARLKGAYAYKQLLQQNGWLQGPDAGGAERGVADESDGDLFGWKIAVSG